MPSYLAFDLGAESGRSILATLDSGKLSLTETHRFPNPTTRINGHYHWNLPSQWEELKTGLRKTLAASRRPIDSLAIDTWGVDFGLITKDNELLSLPYVYRDPRTDGMMDRAFSAVPKRQIYETTGIQFMQLNTLFQLLAMKDSALLKSAAHLLFMPDLFTYLFTAKAVCEYSIASTSQMLDARTQLWATDLLNKLQIPTHFLGQIIPPGTKVAPLQKSVREELNAPEIPVIATAGHDTAAAVAAVPATGSDWCYISSGTWSLMGVELPAPIINDTTLALNYTNEGGYHDTIRLLKNIMGLWLVQESRRHFQKQGTDLSYAELTKLAANEPPLKSLINPDHPPFLTPGDMPTKIADFCRNTHQPVPQSPAAVIRTCLDSLALTYKRTLEGLEKILGKQINTIHIVGGGTQNELLNQLTADACNRTVITGPIEATAIGNVIIQSLALGHLKSLDEARHLIAQSFPLKTYHPTNPTPWQSAYTRYQQLVQ